MNERLLPWTLRAVAIAIAIAGVIDPAITSNRTTHPEVAVVAIDAQADSAEAARVARSLAGAFAVIPASLATADATVLVGDHLPGRGDAFAAPVFAVYSDRSGPTAALESVEAPASGLLETHIVITAHVQATGARGRTLDVTLRAGGLAVDHVTRTIATDDDQLAVPLVFVPASAGAAPLHLSVALDGAPAAAVRASADFLIDVHDTRWAVLFFDPRPSWMSTFVRRAIEQDHRFIVTSRVVTSRNISTDAGHPPGRLDDLAALGVFDAVIVGAPETLTAEDVAGLDAFLRRRGGRVILLLDQRVAGPYDRLTDAGNWRTLPGTTTGDGVRIDPLGSDSGGLRGSDLVYPEHPASGAAPVASVVSKDSTARQAIVWRAPVGPGELIVSGALDAWRFRDPSVSAFDHFWQTVLADAANAAPPAIGVTVTPGVVAPGDSAAVTVTLRDAALEWPARPDLGPRVPIGARVGATMEIAGAPRSIRLWPTEMVGQFRGVLRAPLAPGSYRVVVAGDGHPAEAPFIVAAGASHPAPDAHDLLAVWVASRGGNALPAARMGALAGALRSAIRPAPRREQWYPMRSPWWIVPFALALAWEWWWRRRRGLA